jgi:hypothetical protein
MKDYPTYGVSPAFWKELLVACLILACTPIALCIFVIWSLARDVGLGAEKTAEFFCYLHKIVSGGR